MIECCSIMNSNIKKFVIFSLTIIGLLFAGLFSVQAQYGPYEGVPPAGQILVDKQVKDPSKKGDVFVENLSVNDYHFSPGEDITFKIKVKNTGNTTFSKVEVKDILPQYVDFVLGSGNVNKDIHNITFTHGELKPDELWEFDFTARVFPANEIPDTQAVYCDIFNKAQGWANGQTDTDTAFLCIKKEVPGPEGEVLGVQPPAGANILPLGLSFIGISALGLLMKKKLKVV